MTTKHESLRGLIHGHFSSGLAPADEARLRDHLLDCMECRRIYECHQMAEKLDPAARSPRERLAHAFGISSVTSRFLPRRRSLVVASLAVVGAVALTLMVNSHGGDGIAPRGSAPLKAAAVDLAVFRINGQGESTRVRDAVSAHDELAFAYRNEVGKAFLMIFAVDSQNRVVWYHPAWTNSEDNPQALAITTQVGFKELPEAVRHPVWGPSLTVYALFMDTSLNVRAVETRVANGAFLAQAEAGEILHVLPLKVLP
jgi:hypothetical protein